MRIRRAALAVCIVAGAAIPALASSPAAADPPEDDCEIYCPGAINQIQVPGPNGTWTPTDCTMFPIDNVWHSTVTDESVEVIQDLDPEEFDYSEVDYGEPVLRARFAAGSTPATSGHGINVISSAQADRKFWIDAGSPSDLNRSEWNQRDPVWYGYDYFMRHESPAKSALKWQDMNNGVPFNGAGDNHLYFVDAYSDASRTDQGASCLSHEYIGYNPLVSSASTLKVMHGVTYDLTANTRRLSSDAASPLPYSVGPGYAGLVGGYKNDIHAQGGSGLSGLAGMIRVDEVFANSTSADQTVRATGGIDHALGAVLPSSMIRSSASTDPEFTWPATRSDGTQANAATSVPMGSRLRMKAAECAAFDTSYTGSSYAQARLIVDAMCEHGLIVIDSSQVFGLYGEMSNKWLTSDLAALSSLGLGDFEVVDAEPMRRVTGGADCSTNWNQPSTTQPCNSLDWLAVN